MTTNHADFIRQSLGTVPFGADRHIDTLAQAYSGRDQELSNSIVQRVQALFGNRYTAAQVSRELERVGLPPFRAPEPTPAQAAAPQDLAAQVTELAGTVNRLVEAARRQGIEV